MGSSTENLQGAIQWHTKLQSCSCSARWTARRPGRGGAAPMPHDGAVGRRRLEGGGSAPRATAATRGRRRLEGGCGDPGPVPAATLGKDFGTVPGRPNVSWRRVGATNGVGG